MAWHVRLQCAAARHVRVALHARVRTRMCVRACAQAFLTAHGAAEALVQHVCAIVAQVGFKNELPSTAGTTSTTASAGTGPASPLPAGAAVQASLVPDQGTCTGGQADTAGRDQEGGPPAPASGADADLRLEAAIVQDADR